MDTMPT